MADLIDRQAAIDAICTWDKFGVDERGRVVRWHEGLEPYVHLRDVVTAIVNLPSAQPEPCEYWDAESNYCALSRPSAQPEQKEPCSLCAGLENRDTLYVYSDVNDGNGFDYIRDIKFCPVCGRRLNNG